MSIGLQKAKELNADILLGTDPDSDRVAIGIKNTKGDWVLMNGNQTAVLAFNYMIEARKAKALRSPMIWCQNDRYYRYDRYDCKSQ
jgi:phosphoglucomutase